MTTFETYPELEALRQRLTGTRQRAPGTIITYLDTAKKFLLWRENRPLDRQTVDAYFSLRRKNNISERTLRKEFAHLKKLFMANTLKWDFDTDDVPFSDVDPHQPAFTEAQINRLIESQNLYTAAERFYLAVSTTFGCRREELARIGKRQVDHESIVILTAKHGLKRKHLIPDCLKPIIEGYHVKEHAATSLSTTFRQITKKAGMELTPGYGWHSIRRCLDTLADYFLAKNDLPPALWADFVGWAKTTRGVHFTGAAMAGVYSHPEIMGDDPYRIDRLIYPVHPFLRTWERVLGQSAILTERLSNPNPETISNEKMREIIETMPEPEPVSPLDSISEKLKRMLEE